MPTTTNQALPYPAASAAPDVPGDVYALAKRIDDLGAVFTIALAGSYTNIAGGTNASRSGYAGQLNVAVQVVGGTSANGTLLSINGVTNANKQEQIMGLQDENSSFRGWCYVALNAGTNPTLTFTKAYIDGASQTTLPQNYRVHGTVGFRPA